MYYIINSNIYIWTSIALAKASTDTELECGVVKLLHGDFTFHTPLVPPLV
jgi:hypothetical protein